MKKWQVLPVVLVMLLAFRLRLWGLDDRNIWFDEGWTIWLSRMPTWDLISRTASDVHPPLHYLIVKVWSSLVESGVFVARYSSVLIGLVGIAFAYRLGRRLGGYWAGILTILFLSISLFNIRWSQEIRMHVLAATFSTAALWAAVRFWQSGGWRAWAAYVLSVTMALYTLYLTVTLPIVTNLAFVFVWWRWRRPSGAWRKWLAAQVAILLLYLPWIIYGIPQRLSISTLGHEASASFVIETYLVALAVGIHVNIGSYLPQALSVLVILLASVYSIRRSRRTMKSTAGLTVLLLGLTIPVFAVLAVVLPLHPDIGRPLAARYFLPLSVAFYTLLGWGLARFLQYHPWAAGVGVLLVAGIAASGLLQFYPDRVRRDEYDSIAAILNAHRQRNDSVILHSDHSWPVFTAFYDGSWEGIWNGVFWDEAQAQERLDPIWQDTGAVWLILNPDAQRIDPDFAVQRWLESRARDTLSWEFGDKSLLLFTRTPERTETLYDLNGNFISPDEPLAKFSTGGTLLDASLPLFTYPSGEWLQLSLYWERPPLQSITLEITGAARHEQIVEPPVPARQGVTRQQIGIHLPPNLPEGRYKVLMQTEGDQVVNLEEFELQQVPLPGTVTDPFISTDLKLQFGESIELLGYDVATEAGKPGDTIEVTLYWRALDYVPKHYKVSVALMGQRLNPRDNTPLWGQQDNEPVNWQAPTTLWLPGDVIADRYHVAIDLTAPPGEYVLLAVMYGLVDGVRLSISDVNGNNIGDMAQLQTFEVRR
jgi:hypothetical protein